MENKTELTQLRHPDYDRELTELVRSNLSPKAFREKLLDYHENDIAAALEALTLSERQRYLSRARRRGALGRARIRRADDGVSQ